jgi:enamine deaminase RidA (YjgF/YER057c/UK114 family)
MNPYPVKKILTAMTALSALTLADAQIPKKPAEAIQRIAKPDRSGTALTVRAADGPMMFTGQIFAADVTREARAQAEQALDLLGIQLTKAGGDLQRVLRLNAYVADDTVTPIVDAVIAARFAGAPPALTLVRTPLAVPGALVAFDAIAAVTRAPATVEIMADGAAVMPAGGKVFVSGQANTGKDLATSVALTMERLHASIAHLGLKKSDIVQVKAFITPCADHATAVAEVKRTFAGGPVPPVVLIEWLSSSPAEIELVASAPTLARKPEEAAAFLGLPGMTSSPYYCRVATVAAGAPLIFITGIDGGEGGTPREQWKRIFDQLGSALFEVGSSFRHLVKATYFLADPNARQALGDIRAVYYDPTRPPAASALSVTSIGRPKRSVMLDMIAVPAK